MVCIAVLHSFSLLNSFHHLFICLPTDAHLGYFQGSSYTEKAAMNINV